MSKRFLSISLILLFTVISITNQAQIPDWGDTVLTEITDTQSMKQISHGALFVDDSNLLHSVFRQSDGDNWNVYYVTRDDQDIWSDPELVGPLPITLNNVNVISIPYQNDIEIYGVANDVLYRVSRDVAQTWEYEIISTGTENVMQPHVTVDGQGTVHIVGITTTYTTEPKLIYITNHSGEWDYSVLASSELGPFGTGAGPTIQTSDSGIAVISYRGGDYQSYRVHVAQNLAPGSFEWNYEIVVSPDMEDLPSDVKVVGDTIHLAISGQNGWGFPWSTYYLQRPLDANTWTAPQLVSSTLSLNDPTMVVDNEGYVHIVTSEIDGNFATGEIFYSHNNNPDNSWTVTNIFTEVVIEYPLLKLDHAGKFQMLGMFFGVSPLRWEIAHIGGSYEMVLPTPTNLSAVVDSFNVYLEWESPDLDDLDDLLTLEGYNLYRQSSPNSDFILMNENELITETDYLFVNLLPSNYGFYVTAVFETYGESAPSNIVNANVMDFLWPPEFNPLPGEYDEPIYVELISPNNTGTIYYTLDGTEPTMESTVYSELIYIDSDTTIKARTYDPDWITSDIAVGDYIIEEPLEQLPPPVFNPEPGHYDSFIHVEISSPTGFGTIYYTLDGTDPTTESSLYEEMIFVEEDVIIKARTYEPNWIESDIATAQYTIDTSSVEDGHNQPLFTGLLPAKPNPFNPSTNISYALQEQSMVNLDIYNARGQLVRNLVSEVKLAGIHEVVWNGKDNRGQIVSSGLYFTRMQTNESVFLNKMMMLK